MKHTIIEGDENYHEAQYEVTFIYADGKEPPKSLIPPPIRIWDDEESDYVVPK